VPTILEQSLSEECLLCHKIVTTDFDFHLAIEHFKQELLDAINEKPPYVCQECHRNNFTNYDDLVKHLVKEHDMAATMYVQRLNMEHFECLMCKNMTQTDLKVSSVQELRAHFAIGKFQLLFV
jgi:hypothetical protein